MITAGTVVTANSRMDVWQPGYVIVRESRIAEAMHLQRLQMIVQNAGVGDRLAKFWNARTGCVFGKTRFQRRDRGRLNVFGSVEVRLACSKAANIDSFGFHRLRLTVDGKGKGRS